MAKKVTSPKPLKKVTPRIPLAKAPVLTKKTPKAQPPRVSVPTKKTPTAKKQSSNAAFRRA